MDNQIPVQQIAVFGESGSGKTVMVSSFYGATQEPEYLKRSLFRVVADDIGQGSRLHRNYLGMRDAARLPMVTRFTATSYSFSVRLKDGSGAKPMRAGSFDTMRLIWHDYPGEWFEDDVSGPEEAKRRVDTFRSLLGSDVALLLVDGQQLLDNNGQEERYLKSLLTNFRNGLLSLKDDLLVDGSPLVRFPRIWVMALSKSDLLPDMNVYRFRDLLIDKACDDMDELRKVLASLVQTSEALSVGEDFMLISSAKFDSDRIEVGSRVGLDLILPLAAMLPFERLVRWTQVMQVPGKVLENLIGHAGALIFLEKIGRKVKLPGPTGRLLKVALPVSVSVAQLAGDKVREMNSAAVAKRDSLAATLTSFRLDLDKGEEEEILLRSRR